MEHDGILIPEINRIPRPHFGSEKQYERVNWNAEFL